jgi:hypothetical protein
VSADDLLGIATLDGRLSERAERHHMSRAERVAKYTVRKFEGLADRLQLAISAKHQIPPEDFSGSTQGMFDRAEAPRSRTRLERAIVASIE